MEKSWEKPWEKPVKDREELRPIISTMGMQGHICWFLGTAFAALGVVAGAMNIAIGLQSIHWFLLAIVFFVAGIPAWLTLLWARHLLGIEPKKER